MEKVIKCKFCGEETAALTEDSLETVLIKVSQASGVAAAILRGDPLSAYKNATGETQERIIKLINRFVGGTYYTFVCQNPECGQSFEKRVLL